MNIVIAGGTGFIGQSLVHQLLKASHRITVLGRSAEKITKVFGNQVIALTWDEFEKNKIQHLLQQDFVVNLTGAGIGDKKWTFERKKEILDSRLAPTFSIAKGCADLGEQSPALFNASAVGIYGLQRSVNKTFDESSPLDFSHAADFLSEVAKKWESATSIAKDSGVRVVNMRFGVVLGKNGGALQKIKIPFLLFLGGPIGNGQQPFAWIAMPDLIKGIQFLMAKKEISGPVNLVSPHCITQRELAKAMGKVLHRPSFIKTPQTILTWMYGDMATELLLSGQCVVPKILLENNFEFVFPNIESALENSLR